MAVFVRKSEKVCYRVPYRVLPYEYCGTKHILPESLRNISSKFFKKMVFAEEKKINGEKTIASNFHYKSKIIRVV